METWTEKPDLSTILQPIRWSQYRKVLILIYRGDLVWTELGLPTHKYSNVSPEIFVGKNLELETVSQISSIGPSGGSLLSRVMDLANVARRFFRYCLLFAISDFIGYKLTKENVLYSGSPP